MPGKLDDASEHKEDTLWLNRQARRRPETRKNSYIWCGDNYVLDEMVRNLDSWNISHLKDKRLQSVPTAQLGADHLLLDQYDLHGEWRKNQTGEAILPFDANDITKNE